MNLRSLVATATLVALFALPMLGQNTYIAGRVAAWALFWGMSGVEVVAFAVASTLVCGSFVGPVAVACGFAGVG